MIDLPGRFGASIPSMGAATLRIRPAYTVVAFCLALVAAAWSGVSVALRTDRDRTVDRVMESNANLARAFAGQIGRILGEADKALLDVKARHESAGGDPDLPRYSRDARLDAPPFTLLGLVDADGRILRSSVPAAPEFGDAASLRHHRSEDTGRLYIGRPVAGKTPGKWSVYLTRRINERNGSFAGLAALAVDPHYFSDFYKLVDLGPGSVITVLGRDGIVRARQADDDRTPGQDLRGALALDEKARAGIRNGGAGSHIVTSAIDGMSRIVSYQALRDFPLVIVVGTSEATALAGFHERRSAYLWSAGVATMVILGFGMLLLLQLRRQARMARQLREAEARARLAVESVADYAILTLDKRGHVTSWNTGAQRIKGYTEAEILGQHFSRFHPLQDIEQGVPGRILERAAANGRAEDEGWRVRKDGTRYWAHAVVTALRNKSGALRGYGEIVRDLTVAKLTEDALQRSEARFRAIFDQAGVGIGEVSVEGRWLRANSRLCEILGYPLEGLLQLNVRDFTHPDDLESTRVHMLKVLADPGHGHSLQKRYVRRDGTPVWIDLVSVLVSGQGGDPDYIVGIVEDISARKVAESQAAELRAVLEQRVNQRTLELADANKRLESFSYSVSHDLRTPLRAVSGFVQILLRKHSASLDEQGRHYMDSIVRATAQMGRLIEDFLTYSRMGRRSVALGPTSLGDVIGDLARYLQPRLAELSAQFRVEGKLPEVHGDLTLLNQVFLNLFDNALTYRHPARVPVVEVSFSLDADDVIVHVRDNGIGIAPEHFKTIFGLFQRLHGEDEYPGTGIGLATVQQAVEMLGGKVWLDSEVGAGTVFHVRMRRSEVPCGQATAQACGAVAPA